MDDLIYSAPNDDEVIPIVSKHKNRHIVKEPSHDRLSSRQVLYNIPIFTNFDNIISARPSHTTLTQSEVEKAGLIRAMYEEKRGISSITDYLAQNVPSHELVEKVSDNVMVVRNKNT